MTVPLNPDILKNPNFSYIDSLSYPSSYIESLKLDPVNHPSHYTQGGIECIDAIEAALDYPGYVGYLKGNCIKYLWRYSHKNGIEDLEKCDWYLHRLIDTLKRGLDETDV